MMCEHTTGHWRHRSPHLYCQVKHLSSFDQSNQTVVGDVKVLIATIQINKMKIKG